MFLPQCVCGRAIFRPNFPKKSKQTRIHSIDLECLIYLVLYRRHSTWIFWMHCSSLRTISHFQRKPILWLTFKCECMNEKLWLWVHSSHFKLIHRFWLLTKFKLTQNTFILSTLLKIFDEPENCRHKYFVITNNHLFSCCIDVQHSKIFGTVCLKSD